MLSSKSLTQEWKMFKKYAVSLLLAVFILSAPVYIYSQLQPLQPRYITTQGLGPVGMLKYSEKADIIAITFLPGGESAAQTVLQNIIAASAQAQGQNSSVKLMLSPDETKALEAYEAVNKVLYYILIVRNESDSKIFPIEISALTKLFS
jgi:hypothetical protein